MTDRPTTIKTIGVLANCRKPQASEVLQRLARKATALGIAVLAPPDAVALLPGSNVVPPEELGSKSDAVLAIGGDGTMLSAVRLVSESETPLMGVNLGSLGFMTSVPQENAERALEALAAGTYSVSTRSIATCRLIREGRQLAQLRALNDVVLGWGASSRVVSLTLSIDQEVVTSYICDGLIVSTPTGSTGHAMSAGGPILHPETPAFVISVICPHALSHRPIVVPDRSVITVEVTDAVKKLLLSVDGQEEHNAVRGDQIEVRRSSKSVRFLHLPGYSYFSVLRQKLGWRGSSL